MAVAVMSPPYNDAGDRPARRQQRAAPRRPVPPTPPMSATLEHRRPAADGPSRVALPPIAYLDRSLSSMQPLTPPDDGEDGARLPPILHAYPLLSRPHQLFQLSQQLPPLLCHQPAPPVCVWDSAPHLIDWLDFTRTRSAHFIAEKTCEMICYLWFASSPVARRPTKEGPSPADGAEQRDVSTSYPSPHHSPASPSSVTPGEMKASSPTRSPPSTLQLVATPSFISFMQKLLETTQVSQSVIVLSLHYIYRLKERNHFTPAQRGSEFRIAVAGLMMANKFLDDNTYTNKTWSEVSGIELEEINRMEREFLLGVDFNLYVDKPTYESWLNLLKGLVSAKERDSMSSSSSRNSRELGARRRDVRKVSAATTRYHHHQQTAQRVARNQQPYQPSQVAKQEPASQAIPAASYATPTRLPPLSRAVPAAYYYPYNSQYSTPASTVAIQPQSSSTYGRARSTSPTPIGYSDVRMDGPDDPSTTFPPPSAPPSSYIPGYTNKRTAEAAFSPTSATFAHLPSKRPLSMVVTIPESNPASFASASGSRSAGGYEHSPLDSLSNFSRMSLVEGSPEKRQQRQGRYQSQAEQQQQPPVPSTLVAPYSYQVDTRRRGSQPQDLYFYTLASSPMELPVPSRSRAGSRKRGLSAALSDSMDTNVDRDQVMGHDSNRQDSVIDEDEDEDDEVVEMDGGEWERRERERDAHGERRRTRKAKLMRWSTSSSSASSAGGEGSAPLGGYAYDYSREWSAYRQQQQQQQQKRSSLSQGQDQRLSQQQQPSSTPTSSMYPLQHAGHHHHHAAPPPPPSSHAPSVNSSTHMQPGPRSFVPVVQSASTSPTSGVVYVQRADEVGYANGNGTYHQHQHHPHSYASTTAAPVSTQYQYPVREQAQHQQVQPPKPQQQQPPWYTQNQGGSVSYHPSPVQAKAEYYPQRHQDRDRELAYAPPPPPPPAPTAPTTASGVGSGVSLPHFHDNVWTRPPVVLAKRGGGDERGYLDVDVSRSCSQSLSGSDAGSDTGSDEEGEGEEEEDDRVVDDAIVPSAPFANAGPAGVHVPFGSEYARYRGYHQQQQQGGYSMVESQQQPQQQQRNVYTASGQYAPVGSLFTPAYPASYGQQQQQWATRGRGGEY